VAVRALCHCACSIGKCQTCFTLCTPIDAAGWITLNTAFTYPCGPTLSHESLYILCSICNTLGVIACVEHALPSKSDGFFQQTYH
jgi:hypothetical protein